MDAISSPLTSSSESWLGGAGMEFAVADNTSIRTEWTHYDLDSDSVDDLTAAVVFGF